jgi:CheY-like chemotaxis protein
MEQTDRAVALIVEDDADVRQLAAALLEETDLAVVECESGEAALAVMQRLGERIALIFIDIRLPGLIDGVDLARMVKANWPRTKVIVTSGDPGDRLDELPPNTAYMQKPWRALDILVAAERAVPAH